MTTYAVGDIQGCLDPLQVLLEKVSFNAQNDQLWCVGDLVNRGPRSLDTLRFLYEMRTSLVTVLGNHDLHLLACFYLRQPLKRSDTIQEILDAPDAKLLIDWLRQQPLVFYDDARQLTMVHAGIAPQWTLEEALGYSKEVESVLQDDQQISSFLENMYGNKPDYWSDSLTGYIRLRLITNYCTRMRFCLADGTLEFKNKGGLESADKHFMPWFDVPHRKMQHQKIIFGHWAALEGQCEAPNVYALDTGCVWGNSMTLMNVDTYQRYACAESK